MADAMLEQATRIAELLVDVQTRVNARIDGALTELLPEVVRRLGVADVPPVDLGDLVNARITGLSVVVTPAAVTEAPAPEKAAPAKKPAKVDPEEGATN